MTNSRFSHANGTNKAHGSSLETDLVVECAQPDRDAVSSVIKEWLVPLLVREFLAEQQPIRCPSSTLTEKPTFRPLGEV